MGVAANKPHPLSDFALRAPLVKTCRKHPCAGDMKRLNENFSYSCVAFRGSPERDKKSLSASIDSKDKI